MRILQARGDVGGALGVLRNVEQIVQSHHFQMASLIQFKAARVEQWLAAGDVQTASRWAEECRGGSELEQIAIARLLLAQGRADEAQHILRRQADQAESNGRIGRLIEILCLEALALEAGTQSEEAETTLKRALSLARPEGYLRVFLDQGELLHNLLLRIADQNPEGELDGSIPMITRDYLQDVLAAFVQEIGIQAGEVLAPDPQSTFRTEELIDPLTERELEVLGLLAEGLTNKAIAGRLVGHSTKVIKIAHLME